MIGDNALLSIWLEIRALVEEVENDLIKNAKGTLSAGVRSRHRLKMIKRTVHRLQMEMLKYDRIKGFEKHKRFKEKQKLEQRNQT